LIPGNVRLEFSVRRTSLKCGSTEFQSGSRWFSKPSRDRTNLGVNHRKHNLPYISMKYGGESVSQSPLKDRAFSTFQEQDPPFELRRKMGFRLDKSLSRPMARHRQQCHQATSERQIAVGPLSLIALQSRNLMVAHPVLAALLFPSAVDVMKEP
jgi:hypothetical protein